MGRTDYIPALPKEEAVDPEWQAMIEAQMLVADLGMGSNRLVGLRGWPKDMRCARHDQTVSDRVDRLYLSVPG